MRGFAWRNDHIACRDGELREEEATIGGNGVGETRSGRPDHGARDCPRGAKRVTPPRWPRRRPPVSLKREPFSTSISSHCLGDVVNRQ